jgi:predicted ester cyclase
MSEENKEIVRRWQEAYNKGNYDELDELLAPDWVTNGWLDGVPKTIEMAKELDRSIKAEQPDLHYVTDELIAEGDRVVQLCTLFATHNVEVFGCPPTGKELTCGLVNLFRIAHGKIVEHLTFVTELDTLEQMGAPLSEAWLALRHRAPRLPEGPLGKGRALGARG